MWCSAGSTAGSKELSDNRELTPSQASILSRLGKEGDASASDLAAAERVRPQAVAPTLAVLADRGLIERRPDPHDGRRQVISLTRAGRALFEDSRRAGDEWLARAMQEHYTEAERQTLIEAIALLERLNRP
ncbi:MarR family winged helix-turn-helix transcriptional regulator [Nonomuraea sp. LPB2021202275-12-8]|uniref:MarR family winged helix-turn-helix transcriptional regulator n=1 Tax=Nonomuraea sp. LPB2021202275-12-8 TaxID=3120159 RepID=UPI00300D668C